MKELVKKINIHRFLQLKFELLKSLHVSRVIELYHKDISCIGLICYNSNNLCIGAFYFNEKTIPCFNITDFNKISNFYGFICNRNHESINS